jgi:hypothetical protein
MLQLILTLSQLLGKLEDMGNTFVNSPIADGAGYVETWEIP